MMKKSRVDPFGIALEAALRHLELESVISGLLCGAMERVADGTYGRCIGCSGTIAPERLKALPWVQLCVACQDAVDQRSDHDRSFAFGHTPDESEGEPSATSTNLPDGRGPATGYPIDPSKCLDPVGFIGMVDMQPTRKKR